MAGGDEGTGLAWDSIRLWHSDGGMGTDGNMGQSPRGCLAPAHTAQAIPKELTAPQNGPLKDDSCSASTDRTRRSWRLGRIYQRPPVVTTTPECQCSAASSSMDMKQGALSLAAGGKASGS